MPVRAINCWRTSRPCLTKPNTLKSNFKDKWKLPLYEVAVNSLTVNYTAITRRVSLSVRIGWLLILTSRNKKRRIFLIHMLGDLWSCILKEDRLWWLLWCVDDVPIIESEAVVKIYFHFGDELMSNRTTVFKSLLSSVQWKIVHLLWEIHWKWRVGNMCTN